MVKSNNNEAEQNLEEEDSRVELNKKDSSLKLKEEDLYDILKLELGEYRNIKESYTDRINMVLVFISIFVGLTIDKIEITKIINMMNKNLTFFMLIKIISGILVYIFLIFSIIQAFLAIKTSKLCTLDTSRYVKDLVYGDGVLWKVALRDLDCKANKLYDQIENQISKHFNKEIFFAIMTLVSFIIYCSVN